MTDLPDLPCPTPSMETLDDVFTWLDAAGVPPGTLRERLACCCVIPPERPETAPAFADGPTYRAMASQGLTIEGAVARARSDLLEQVGDALEGRVQRGAPELIRRVADLARESTP